MADTNIGTIIHLLWTLLYCSCLAS